MNLKFMFICCIMLSTQYSKALKNIDILNNNNDDENRLLLNCSLLDVNNQNILNKINGFRECLKEKIFDSLSDLVNKDLINVCDGINLLKYNETGEKLSTNKRKFVYNHTNNGRNLDWPSRVLGKIQRLFNSHVLRVDLQNFVNKGRGKHGHKMSSLIVFALVATGMILAPMGFKFLVVLGTKALLLAMLAMILTSIQGLKKIATSKINYGLYETHATNPCTYDRRWYYKYGNGIKPADDTNYQQTEGYNYLNPRDSIDIKRIENSYMT